MQKPSLTTHPFHIYNIQTLQQPMIRKKIYCHPSHNKLNIQVNNNNRDNKFINRQFTYYIMLCLKCKGEEVVITCTECDGSLCLPCSRSHFGGQQHILQSYYFCQECEDEKATQYCYSCDQNLCGSCNKKIHNKGKRSQHKVQDISQHSKFTVRFLVVVLQDAAPNAPEFQAFITTLKEKMVQFHKGDIKKQDIYFLWEKEASPPEGFSHVIITQDLISDEYLKEYSKYFPILQKTLMIESADSKQIQSKLSVELESIRFHEEQESKNNISLAEAESRNNISISTENESITKGRKPAIAYFQFYKLAKNDKKSEVEIHMRKLAAEGQLLVKQKEVEAIQGIIRSFTRTVGELEIEYSSLDISYLSVESLVWVIRSIKVDRMTPGQKLVLSRIKECFDIKVHSKLWQSILAYLTSKKYQQDHQRMATTFYLPKITLQKANDQYLLLLKNQQWVFEDQQKLNESQQSWNEFVKFLLDYFDKHKTIPGGRYGCVQFAKMFGTKSLQNSSLGKLSMYVQEAINKGIIRYHKTLLIKNVIEQHQSFTNESSSILECDYSFHLNEKELYVLQKQIKIKSLQVAMISLLCEEANQSVISLAQIPHNLKKCISFDFNLPDLGFPKLKNLIITLSDIVKLQINKSTLTYTFHSSSQTMIILEKEKLQMMLSDYFRMINEILSRIMIQHNCMNVNDLYTQLNAKIGFEFQFRLYGATDFCQFLCCYCVEIMNIQIVNGALIAYSNQPSTSRTKPGPEISTPDFCNSFQAKNKPFSCKLPESFYNWVDDLKDDDGMLQQQMGEGISDIEEKHLYSIMDDDGEKSETTLRTFIEKENIANNLNLSIYTLKPQEVIVPNPKNHNKALSQDFDAHKRTTTHGRSTSYVQGKNKTPEEMQG